MENNLNKIGITYKRPWGYYKTLMIDQTFQCKVICIRPKGKLSLQKHFHRSEHWVVVKGSLLVTKGKSEALKTKNLCSELLPSLQVCLGCALAPGDSPARLTHVHSRKFGATSLL